MPSKDLSIRSLDPVNDWPAIDALWDAVLGDIWPLKGGQLTFVATGGAVVDGNRGIAAVALTNGSALIAIVVTPHRQGGGLGRALVDAVAPRSIGSGGARYLWPGVPTNLPGALSFFEAAGWRRAYQAWDYIADLSGHRAPQIEPTPGIRYVPAARSHRDDVVRFNEQHFPNWARYFAAAPLECIFVALDSSELVVASLLLEWQGHGDVGPWQRLLGEEHGSLGAVGVDPAHQNRRIGTGLVAHATAHLRSHGVTRCHVGWLVRTSFYEFLGFSPWRSYQVFDAHGMSV